ncbi:hypothetical protein DSO57_1000517 [Entomophthora muscae]|uniref:Uncharacterized protein n=1 Tax=Entomophthora muscae TaxID=34485 RepID=A0ACC2RP69_9FUNG|nr:hypothetical protein DSO57_1000517 [Entomophthora muscae]
MNYSIPKLQIENLENEEVVHQRLLLITGTLFYAGHNVNGEIRATDHSGFDCGWPLIRCKFKALIPLVSGNNRILFRYLDLVFAEVSVNYLPLVDNPPVKLALLVASDSDLNYDVMRPREECGVASAIAKFRMSAYLWQAFIGEEMRQAGLGRRSIRLQENWEKDTLTHQDRVGNTAEVVIVRTTATMKQIRDADIAQQYTPGPNDPPIDTSKPSLFQIFSDALKAYSGCQQEIVAGLILDTKWDKSIGLVRGHAALGGGNGKQMLGIFGSHCTHAWPSCLEEVAGCFLDKTNLDQRLVADEKKGKGQLHDAASIGIGAFLHELGHALGLPHTPYGIMARGFEDFNKAFLPLDEQHAAHLYPSNLLRLRHHPALALPADARFASKPPCLFATPSGIQTSHPDGLAQMILWHHETMLRYEKLGGSCRKDWKLDALIYEGITCLTMEVCSVDGSSAKVENIADFHRQSVFSINPPIFLSQVVGHSRPPDAAPFRVFLYESGRPAISIQVITGSFVDGFKFFFKPPIPPLLIGGKNQKSCKITDFKVESGDQISKVDVRAGFWIDGVCLTSSCGINSGWLGGNGGSLYSLKAPVGYQIVGLHGYASESLVFSLGIIYSPISKPHVPTGNVVISQLK